MLMSIAKAMLTYHLVAFWFCNIFLSLLSFLFLSGKTKSFPSVTRFLFKIPTLITSLLCTWVMSPTEVIEYLSQACLGPDIISEPTFLGKLLQQQKQQHNAGTFNSLTYVLIGNTFLTLFCLIFTFCCPGSPTVTNVINSKLSSFNLPPKTVDDLEKVINNLNSHLV